MAHPKSKSISAMIEGLTIFAKYKEHGLDEKYFCGAEHDELHIYVSTDELKDDSEDGMRLIALGFHPNEDLDGWGYFT